MRPDHRGWAAWFFALILVNTVLALSGVQPNDINELEAPAPGWEPGRILDDQYYREIDAWALDNGAAEGLGRWARFEIDYDLFNDSTSPDFVVGDNGTIFSRNLSEQPCSDIDAITLPEGAGGAETEMLFAVSLPKAHFLRGLMPSFDRPEECTVTARDALLERLSTDPRFLDINAIASFAAEANLSVTEPGFNASGRAWAALSIVDRFQSGLWDVEALVASPSEINPAFWPRLGSVASITVDDFVVDRGATVTVVSDAQFFGLTSMRTTTATDAEVIPGVTYLVGDSLLGSLMPLLEPYFEELVYINWSRTSLGPVNLDALPTPNRALVQVPEARATELLAQPLVTDIAAAIAPLEN